MDLPGPDAIRRLLRHLPTFQRPSEELWREGGGQRLPDGSITFPYAIYVLEVEAFLADLGTLGFIVPFDWPRWTEGRRMLERPELIAEASLEDCVKLFTMVIRSARFSWGESYDLGRGIFRLILERLARLVADAEPPRD